MLWQSTKPVAFRVGVNLRVPDSKAWEPSPAGTRATWGSRPVRLMGPPWARGTQHIPSRAPHRMGECRVHEGHGHSQIHRQPE